MSIGYGASCRKVSEDSMNILYEYYSYNLNEKELRNPNRIYDGTILIQKSCLAESSIHTKFKRIPNSKKKTIEKRITLKVNLSERLSSGKIKITNSCFAWHFIENEIDIMSIRLCQKIFENIKKLASCQMHADITCDALYKVMAR